MYKIIICDDDQFTLKWLSELIEEAVILKNGQFTLTCKSSSAEELLKYIAKNEGPFLCFLDLDLGENRLGGLDLAREIRKQVPESKIAFVTSHLEKSMDILKSGVEPFGFIEKNMSHQIMLREFMTLIEKLEPLKKEAVYEEGARKISLPIGIDEFVELQVEQILYIEALKNVPHNICYHSVDGSEITVRDTLEHVAKEYGQAFVYSHRSILVNPKNVIGVINGELKLANGEYVPCAVSKRKMFERVRG